jgi:hypothetical protein
MPILHSHAGMEQRHGKIYHPECCLEVLRVANTGTSLFGTVFAIRTTVKNKQAQGRKVAPLYLHPLW